MADTPPPIAKTRSPEGIEVGYGSAALKLFGPNVACILVNLAIIGVVLWIYYQATVRYTRMEQGMAALQLQQQENRARYEQNWGKVQDMAAEAKEQRQVLQDWVYRLLDREYQRQREPQR